MIGVIVNIIALLLVIGLMVRRADIHTPNPSHEGNYGGYPSTTLRQAQGDKKGWSC
jgi:hypothetical protein